MSDSQYTRGFPQIVDQNPVPKPLHKSGLRMYFNLYLFKRSTLLELDWRWMDLALAAHI